MKNHTKVYFRHFGYGQTDMIPSEVSGLRATDIHHIDPRGMGGSKTKDYIENLIALTRDEHDKAESGKISKEQIKEYHTVFINYFRLNKRPYMNGVALMKLQNPKLYLHYLTMKFDE